MAARSRLVLAFTVSGLVLGALAGDRLQHPWWAAALAPAPLVAAMRCLSLPLGVALALVVGGTARAVGAFGDEGAALAPSALGALALLPALLADRSCTTRWPGLGALTFPLSVVAIDAGLRALGLAGAALPVAALPVAALPVGDAGPLAGWAHGVGWVVPPLACAAIAQAVGGLCSLGNWHRPEPLSQEAREAGVRQSAVAVTLAMVALMAAAPLLTRIAG